VPALPSASSNASSGSSGNQEQRMEHLEQQLNNLQSNENIARIDSLQDQIQSLRAQVEELTHQLQQAQSEQKARDADIDNRLSQQGVRANKKLTPGVNDTNVASDSNDDSSNTKIVTKSNAKIASAKQSAKIVAGANTANEDIKSKKSLDDQPNVAEEQQIYQTAYNLIKVKKYNEAVEALQGMLKKYPSGQFASNAHYWLGELYGLMGKNELALNEFGTVVSSYPDSPRVSDAQLKLGLIYSTQSKWSDAKTSFRKVINRYPGTASARVASEQLKQIKTSGH
jgi:tol-pal system protein YbgF